MELGGIHHLTAVTAQAAQNRAFYTETLGLRLVKKTVNQDDVSAYHLFYADGEASPGTDITFFDFPAAPERRGSRTVSLTGLRVDGADALDYWAARLADAGIAHGGVVAIDGRASLPFDDPEGQRLCLVDDGGAGPAHPWDRSPVPAAQQIRGLGPIVITVPDAAPTGAVLTQLMSMRQVREYADAEGHPVQVFEMGPGGPGAELHVAARPDLPTAVPGAGGVHHVAFRITDDAYDGWAAHLQASGIPNSGPVNRFYFCSLYFREPNGVLFEIATDGPGFAVDEPSETLGESLSLPPFLEDRRAAIEAGLKPL